VRESFLSSIARGRALCRAQYLREAVLALDGPGVDAIIQVGSNLPFARVAAEGDIWLGKPVILANTASYWHALRSNGIIDKVQGYGSRSRTVLGGTR